MTPTAKVFRVNIRRTRIYAVTRGRLPGVSGRELLLLKRQAVQISRQVRFASEPEKRRLLAALQTIQKKIGALVGVATLRGDDVTRDPVPPPPPDRRKKSAS